MIGQVNKMDTGLAQVLVVVGIISLFVFIIVGANVLVYGKPGDGRLFLAWFFFFWLLIPIYAIAGLVRLIVNIIRGE
jgi:hypothetical protein